MPDDRFDESTLRLGFATPAVRLRKKAREHRTSNSQHRTSNESGSAGKERWRWGLGLCCLQGSDFPTMGCGGVDLMKTVRVSSRRLLRGWEGISCRDDRFDESTLRLGFATAAVRFVAFSEWFSCDGLRRSRSHANVPQTM